MATRPRRFWFWPMLLAGKFARLMGWVATGAWPHGPITVDYHKAWSSER